MADQMREVAAVLASLDIGRTVEFCEQRLGFTTDSVYDGYAIFRRGSVQVHYWLCSDRYIAENTSCYVYVNGIEKLYEEYQGQGVIHPNGALETKPWGVKEFAVLDVDGNLYKFGELLPAD